MPPKDGEVWVSARRKPLDPGDEDAAFGLCDLGLGCPELGYVSLAELATVSGRLGLPVERGHVGLLERGAACRRGYAR